MPTLLLAGRHALVETFAIIDALDEMVPAERALLPRSGPVRRDGLRIAALSSGLADKAASLMYEPMFRASPSRIVDGALPAPDRWTLGVLEADRAARCVALLARFVAEPPGCRVCLRAALHPRGAPRRSSTRTATRRSRPTRARCEALPEFAAVYQPITNVV